MKNLLRNICIAAHVDAGKTSLAEQILFQSGTVRQLGSVDQGSSFFDSSPIEKRRGITIFSEQSSVNWRGHKINIIDTPGHSDFFYELERPLEVVDGVVIIISAVEGVQQYTETIWEMVKRKKIPAIFFINKIDRVDSDYDQVFKDISRNLTKDAIQSQIQLHGSGLVDFYDILLDRLISQGENSCSEFINSSTEIQAQINSFLETLAEKDNFLLEKYLNDEPIELPEIKKSFQELIRQSKVFPVIFGSARTGHGCINLLEYLVEFFPSPNVEANGTLDASLQVFKVKHEDSASRMAYAKVLSGEIKVRDTIYNSREEESKVVQIRSYQGSKYQLMDKLEAGDIGVICGLKNVSSGEILGRNTLTVIGSNLSQPYFQTSISPMKAEDWPQLQNAASILTQENPILGLQWDQDAKEMYLNLTGTIHHEVLEEQLKNRFGLDIKFAKPSLKYLETILERSTGFCHFEPKKHYAEVEFSLEPNDRGAGIAFLSAVSQDELPMQYQKAIEKAIPEALQHGALAGNQVVDIKVTLVAGKHHLEHTHGGDFRIATIRAIQQALENNKTVLLEPVIAFKIVVNKDYSGRIISDILKMKGTYHEPEINGDQIILSGKMPLATSLDYPQIFSALTGGKGSIICQPSAYQICHNQDELLDMLNDDKLVESAKDNILYNSVSLFRSKRKMKKVINDSIANESYFKD